MKATRKKPSRARTRDKARNEAARLKAYRKGEKGSKAEQRSAWKARARGRPGAYMRDFHPEESRSLALLGLNDEEIAQQFQIDMPRFYDWQKRHPDFRKALMEGKLSADAKMARSLFQRGIGYEHQAVKIFKVDQPVLDAEGNPVLDKDGRPIIEATGLYLPYTERFPPDVAAQKMWLTNRQPKRWRDRQDLKVDGNITLGDIVARSYELEREREKDGK